MTAPESVEVKLTRLEVKLDSLTEALRGTAKQDAELRQLINDNREDVRRENTGLRVDLERQLGAIAIDLERHENAVNPHPQQEDWLRRHIDRLAVSIDALKEEIAQARGVGRVLWPAISAALAAGGAVVVSRAIGG